MTGSQITGLVCILIGVAAPVYIAVRQRHLLRTPWFVLLTVVDVLVCIFMGMQFFFDRQNF